MTTSKKRARLSRRRRDEEDNDGEENEVGINCKAHSALGSTNRGEEVRCQVQSLFLSHQGVAGLGCVTARVLSARRSHSGDPCKSERRKTLR